MRYYIQVILFVFLFFHTSFAQVEVNQKSLEQVVMFLSSDEMKGRKSGSAEADSTADFILSKFKEYKLAPIQNSYTQDFTYSRSSYYIQPIKTTNILGVIEGSDVDLKKEFIVIGAHYDHIGVKVKYTGNYDEDICNGADDNASGVAALLELARLISENAADFKRSILFVAFSGEEDGLFGSQYFVNNPVIGIDRIKLMLNLDMIGMLSFNEKLLIKGLKSVVGARKIARQTAKNTSFKIDTTPKDDFWCISSDHAPFYNKNIGTLFFTTDLHPYYHTADDDVERIDFGGLKNITNYVYNFARQLSCFKALKFKTIKRTILFEGDENTYLLNIY